MQNKTLSVLSENNIKYLLLKHSRQVFTSEEAAAERGVSVEQIVKTMLLRTSYGGVCMALVPGDQRLSLEKLSKSIDDSVSLIPPKQLTREYHLIVGAISPIEIDFADEIVADQRLKSFSDLTISSGDPLHGILLKSEDLFKLFNLQWCDICE